MAKPNYAFAKRQRDLAKKQKKEEKRRRKLAPNQEAGPEEPQQAVASTSTATDLRAPDVATKPEAQSA